MVLLLAAALIALGFYVKGVSTDCAWLFPLGIVRPDFSSSDYFPLLPNLGYFFAVLFYGVYSVYYSAYFLGRASRAYFFIMLLLRL